MNGSTNVFHYFLKNYLTCMFKHTYSEKHSAPLVSFLVFRNPNAVI